MTYTEMLLSSDDFVDQQIFTSGFSSLIQQQMDEQVFIAKQK
jgi:hypothetical protein